MSPIFKFIYEIQTILFLILFFLQFKVIFSFYPDITSYRALLKIFN